MDSQTTFPSKLVRGAELGPSRERELVQRFRALAERYLGPHHAGLLGLEPDEPNPRAWYQALGDLSIQHESGPLADLLGEVSIIITNVAGIGGYWSGLDWDWEDGPVYPTRQEEPDADV